MSYDRLFRECRTDNGKPKLRYDKRRDAVAAIRLMGTIGNDLQPYRCAVCDYFHIGHYPKNWTTRRRLRARHREQATS